MTNVSKRKLKHEVLSLVSEQLWSFIAKTHTKRGAQTLVSELFTQKEQLMLAKRLAIVLMLDRGSRFEEIQEVLKVSSSTVTNIWKNKRRGAYDSIVRHCQQKSPSGKSLLDILEIVLQAGLPPRGRGRWRRVLSRQ